MDHLFPQIKWVQANAALADWDGEKKDEGGYVAQFVTFTSCKCEIKHIGWDLYFVFPGSLVTNHTSRTDLLSSNTDTSYSF